MTEPMAAAGNPHLENGKRFLQNGELTAALTELNFAVIDNAADPQAHNYLGIAQVRSGSVDEGIRSLERAASMAPDDAQIHYNLALALSRAARHPEAEQHAARALELQPDHEAARQLLDRLSAEEPPAEPLAAPEAAPASSIDGEAAGLHYRAAEASRSGAPPTVQRRLMRGLLWGPVYGQWWTLWSTISLFLSAGLYREFSVPKVVVIVIIFALACAVFGSLTGLILGATGLRDGKASIVGAAVGILLMFSRNWLMEIGFSLITVIFFLITGKEVARRLESRIHQPVLEE